MRNHPRMHQRWFSLRRPWLVSLAVLILFCTSSIVPWSFSSALAATHTSRYTADFQEPNPPFPTGPQGPERWGGTNPSENGFCLQCALAGDPVDAYSGNFSETFTDLSIPGRGVPLLFTRTY